MTLLWDIVLLLAGLALLIKGADFFVEGASMIATKFGIPQIVIGLTIVAFGTSAPEAAVSISASLQGTGGIAIGNILGSNILNVLLILGITSCIRSLNVQKETLYYEIPFTFFITMLLVLMGLWWQELNKVVGLILWALFLVFLVYLIKQSKKGMQESAAQDEMSAVQANIGYKKSMPILILVTAIGLAAIVWGSDLTVDGATGLAKLLGMSDRLIGLTIVAFGTSLPELITSATAAKKGNSDIAIGNIIGSNIFNILFVLGTTALIVDIPYGPEYLIDGIIAGVSVLLLYLAVWKNKKLTAKGGVAMLGVFAFYFVYLLLK